MLLNMTGDGDGAVTEGGWRPCGPEGFELSSWILCGSYCAVGIAALVQRIRQQLYRGGPMQKLFHVLLLMNSTIRAIFFGLSGRYGENAFPGGQAVNLALNIVPDSLFFSTFCLLVMFWAKILYKARNRPKEALHRVKVVLIVINIIVYLIQAVFWGLLSFYVSDRDHQHMIILFFHIQVVILCCLTTLAFVIYGGGVYLLLRRFEVHSHHQQQRMREVGVVTSICSATFAIRAIMVILFISESGPSVQFYLCMAYFMVVEVIPSALVLWVLRRLPRPGPGETVASRLRQGWREVFGGRDKKDLRPFGSLESATDALIRSSTT